jgi:hypothetical protein
MKKSFLIAAVLGAILASFGCSDNSMTKDEMERAKAAKMTDADRQKVADGMARGAQDRLDQQKSWAEKNPEELAKINAERAKMGRPPLGGR